MPTHWWAGEPGILHLWTREPYVDTPAMCGEPARGWDTKPLDAHPMVQAGDIEDLREFINLVAFCDGCREAALQRYYPEEVGP